MKTIIKLSFCFALCLSGSAYALVVTDGTLGDSQNIPHNIPTPVGTRMFNVARIEDTAGKYVNGNLFHSFSTFNIGSTEGVDFVSGQAVNNVISRVTGGASSIDGLLRSSIAGANFYFINPAGVTFGANAVVDVPAAFHVSTADRINAGVGVFYSATDTTGSSTFSAAPESFGFLGNSNNQIKFDGTTLTTKNSNFNVVAGNILIDQYVDPITNITKTASIKTNGGDINLLAVGQNNVTVPSPVTQVTNGTVKIDHASLLDTSGGDNGSGSIKIKGGDIVIDNSSKIFSDYRATIGKRWGAINITGDNLSVSNDSEIRSTREVLAPCTVCPVGSGGIGTIAFPGITPIPTLPTDYDGNVTVNSRNKIEINNGYIYSSALKLDNSNSGAAAVKAGSVTVTSDKLTANGGEINSVTYGKDSAGNVTVNAATITLNKFSIASDTMPISSGNAGLVEVTATDSLTASDSLISSSTQGTGNAGGVTVQTSVLLLDTNAEISALAGRISTGETGVLKLVGVNTATLSSGAKISLENQGRASDPTKIIPHDLVLDIPNLTLSGGIITTKTDGNVDANNVIINTQNPLVMSSGALIDSSSSGIGKAGNIKISAPSIIMDNATITAKTTAKDTVGPPRLLGQNVGSLGGSLGSKGWGYSGDIVNPFIYGDAGNAGSVTVTAYNTLTATNNASINSSTLGDGGAGNVIVTAPFISLDNSSISAQATATSQGQTGSVNVTATQALNLTNNAKITLQNDATVANPAAILPTTLTVTAPNINLTNSSITTASSGMINASDIVINFSDKLMMDPSFISTEAKFGNGGSIYINGGTLIYLKDSGFLTSVSGATSNGGNIFVNADFLIMDTGVIQANAIGGVGGYVNLNLQGLIPSYDNLILGGSWVNWQPFVPGFNVIQAASQTGVSGNVNITSPQFNISNIAKALDAGSLVLPTINRNPCQNSASNSLKRSGKGGLPINEEKDDFIPAAKPLNATATESNPPSQTSQTTGGESCAASSI